MMMSEQVIEADADILKDIDKLEGGGPENLDGMPVPQVEAGQREQLEMLLSVSFGMAAAGFGDHWSLQQAEAQSLATALDPVLEKYLPGMSMGWEITLLMALGMVVVPRVVVTKQQQEKRVEDGKESKESPESARTVSSGDGVREIDSA
jgi:hypothetical protein